MAKRGFDMDWFTIRYEHIYKLVMTIVILVALVGGTFFAVKVIGGQQAQARRAIREAEELVNRAGNVVAPLPQDDHRQALFQEAKKHYDAAVTAYRQKSWKAAKNDAELSMDASRQVLIPDVSAQVSVAEVEGTVEVQKKGTHVFKRLSKGDGLGEGDTVKTGKGANCRLRFPSGNEQIVDEDTILVIQFATGQKQEVSIEKGGVGAKTSTTTGVTINYQQHQVTVDPNSQSAVRGQGNRVTIDMVLGTGRYKGASGQAQQVGAGTRVDAGPEGAQFRTLPPAPELKTPLDKYRFEVADPEKESIQFTWDALPTAGWYEVQISPRSLFSQTIELGDAGKPKTNALTIPGGLPAGTYFWRVRQWVDDSNYGAWSAIHVFTLRSVIVDTGQCKEPPFLEIGRVQAVGTGLFLIEGKAAAGATVTLDNLAVDLNPDGSFSKLHQLSADNQQVIVIRAVVGNCPPREFRVPVTR